MRSSVLQRAHPRLTRRDAPDEGESCEPNGSKRSPAGSSSDATKLVDLAADIELFHDPGETAFATFEVGGHFETSPLQSQCFQRWLRRRFYEREGKAPGAQALRDALGVLEGKAQFEGDEHPVHVRIAGDDDAVYLDLANESGEAVEIDRSGYRVVPDPPVKFRRPGGLRRLPHPQAGNGLMDLRALVNVVDRDWPLVVGWALGALRPSGPSPVLASYGEQGSAKSTTQRILRGIIDPTSAPLRTAPRNERDLMIAAQSNWILGFDNAAVVPPWLSDALARVATGAGFSTRKLYTDAEEVIFEGHRPVLINGIEEVVNRPDLLDRALVIEHPRIADAQRLTERELWLRFEELRPQILGALLDAVVEALRNLSNIELSEFPRMADFAKWAVAGEPALGLKQGLFLETYNGNRASAHEVALESSPIAVLIREIAEQGFEGTATDLLTMLTDRVDDTVTRGKSWPSNPSALSGELRRLAPNLRDNGVEIVFHRTGARRSIEIRRSSEDAVTAVTGVTATSPTEQGVMRVSAVTRVTAMTVIDAHLSTPVLISREHEGEYPKFDGAGRVCRGDRRARGRLGHRAPATGR